MRALQILGGVLRDVGRGIALRDSQFLPPHPDHSGFLFSSVIPITTAQIAQEPKRRMIAFRFQRRLVEDQD